MNEIIIQDIPKWIIESESDIYSFLLENHDQDRLKIDKKYLLDSPNVANTSDLINILECIRYWDLKLIPYEVFIFIHQRYYKENHSEEMAGRSFEIRLFFIFPRFLSYFIFNSSLLFYYYSNC